MWNLLKTDANLELMSQVLNIREATAAVMANREIRSKKAAHAYMRPDIVKWTDVLDPQQGMKDAQQAFDRISAGIKQKERIVIYGDYDADGVMSTVILCKALRMCGADVNFYIPHREEEGYGLNLNAVRAMKSEYYDLIITCDNGISALAETDEARSLGMDVIVIDHHEPGFVDVDQQRKDVLPNALAIIDPKQAACPYPFKEMCAAGISFKLMEAFYRYIGCDFSPIHDELLVLAAIASVCDIVDLIGENRSLVKRGFDILNANKRINDGLGQLLTLKGYMEKPIDTFTLGFVVGPCINASGRLDSAEMSVRLFLSHDTNEQLAIARILSDLNEERKTLTKQCVDRALKNTKNAQENVLVLVDIETHESIAGIVAGRVKETLYKPTIVLTRGTETGILKGSGRSVEGYNLFEALYANRELYQRFGGHAMAAGLSLPEENVDELRKRLNAGFNSEASALQRVMHIDMELKAEDITLILAQELACLAPYGKGNHEPLFLTRSLPLTALRIISEKNTLIFTFGLSKGFLKGIAFGLNEMFLEKVENHYEGEDYRRIVSGQISEISKPFIFDVVHSVETNTYNGKTTVQIRIKDFKFDTAFQG